MIGSSLEAKVAYPDLELGLDRLRLLPISPKSSSCPKSWLGPRGEGIDVTQDGLFSKCGRCWRLLPEVAEDGGLCARCEGVVNG